MPPGIASAGPTWSFADVEQKCLVGRRVRLELANIELKNRHYSKSVEYLQKALSTAAART